MTDGNTATRQEITEAFAKALGASRIDGYINDAELGDGWMFDTIDTRKPNLVTFEGVGEEGHGVTLTLAFVVVSAVDDDDRSLIDEAP